MSSLHSCTPCVSVCVLLSVHVSLVRTYTVCMYVCMYVCIQARTDASAVDWTSNAVNYDELLARLKSVQTCATEKEKETGDRKRKRKEDKKKSKKSKKKKKEAKDDDDDTGDAGKEEEEVVDAEKQTTGGGGVVRLEKRGSHLGRYKRREQGKRVASYSAHDLAAILGVSAADEGTIQAMTTLQRTSNGTTAENGNENNDGITRTSAAKKSEKKKKKKISSSSSSSLLSSKAVTEGDDDDACPSDADAHDAAEAEVARQWRETEWWGSKLFIYGGKLGGLHEKRSGRNGDGNASPSNGFFETDQEKLFNDATEAQTKGRKGLGRAAATIGPAWAGTKQTFNDEVPSEPATTPMEGAEDVTMTTEKKEKKKKKEKKEKKKKEKKKSKRESITSRKERRDDG